MYKSLESLHRGNFAFVMATGIISVALEAQDLSALLWVVMGAAAISANAGTSLLESQEQLVFLAN
jgi:hypothetical protein